MIISYIIMQLNSLEFKKKMEKKNRHRSAIITDLIYDMAELCDHHPLSGKIFQG